MIRVHVAPVDDLVFITVGEDKGDIDTGLSCRRRCALRPFGRDAAVTLGGFSLAASVRQGRSGQRAAELRDSHPFLDLMLI